MVWSLSLILIAALLADFTGFALEPHVFLTFFNHCQSIIGECCVFLGQWLWLNPVGFLQVLNINIFPPGVHSTLEARIRPSIIFPLDLLALQLFRTKRKWHGKLGWWRLWWIPWANRALRKTKTCACRLLRQKDCRRSSRSVDSLH